MCVLCLCLRACDAVCVCVFACGAGAAVNMQFSNSRGGDWSRCNGTDGDSSQTVAGQFKEKSINSESPQQDIYWKSRDPPSPGF